MHCHQLSILSTIDEWTKNMTGTIPEISLDDDGTPAIPSSPAKKRSKTRSIFETTEEDDAAAAAAAAAGDGSTTRRRQRRRTTIVASDLYARKAQILEAYQHGVPYPHGQIRNVFMPEFVRDLTEEIKRHSTVKFKESDLFRVYQSIDLANLNNTNRNTTTTTTSPHNVLLPQVLQLREVLYSQEWRSFMEQVAGLAPGTLTAQVDCACNCHAPGCHLLCHDDVIGTRKLSYILYLTAPDWSAPDEGGYLELYGCNRDNKEEEKSGQGAPPPNEPHGIPVSMIEPLFNSLAYFEVVPGRSYHAVQEVLGTRPRLSLQGWYHATTPPPNIEKATLQDLKARRNTKTSTPLPRQEDKDQDGTDKEIDIETVATAGAGTAAGTTATTATKERFTDQDRRYLQRYIQPEYLTDQAMKAIRLKFENDSSVQFRNFLVDEWVPTQIPSLWDETTTTTTTNDNDNDKKPAATESMLTTLSSSKQEDDDGTNANENENAMDIQARYSQDITSEWKLTGPVHKQRFLRYDETSRDQNQNDEDEDVHNDDNRSSTTATTADADRHTGRLLTQVQQQVFASAAFFRYLQAVTSLDPPTSILSQEVRKFRPGLDYTIAHYGLLQDASVLDATLCFVSSTTEDEQGMWECGDSGGFECYIEAEGLEDEDEDDAEHADNDEDDDTTNANTKSNSAGASVAANSTIATTAANDDRKRNDPKGPADEYNEDDDTELLSVSASNNTLSLVYRDPGTMRFVKYVSASAPSARYDICMEYELPPDDEEDDEIVEDDDDDNDDDEDDEIVPMKQN